jgi:predicted ribosomally synthesized peptide with SipW-like signal peptide
MEMEINKKILASVFIISMLAFSLGYGTYSYFNDTETSSGNTFTAGTLDLKVDGQDDGETVVHYTLSNMKPGDDSGYYKWVLKNTGTLPGKVSVTFSLIINYENGQTEPEALVDPTAGELQGELGQYLKPGVQLCDENGNPLIPGITIIDFNYEEGWCIAMVEDEIDTGGTIGWGPKGSSVPSLLYSQWQAGPPHPWGVPGLNGLGGKTYGTLSYLPGDILNPGQEVAFFFRVKLDSDLQRWDGTKWVDVVDDIIQSDSVVFDITFHLVQVLP